jgi:hypothetical protein
MTSRSMRDECPLQVDHAYPIDDLGDLGRCERPAIDWLLKDAIEPDNSYSELDSQHRYFSLSHNYHNYNRSSNGNFSYKSLAQNASIEA